MIELFRTLIHELALNPNIKILTYKEYNLLNINEIKEIEKDLPSKLPKELKDFYSQTNGLSLGWIHKNDKSATFSELKELKLPKDINKAVSMATPEYRANYTNQSGSIEIKGIKEVFTKSFHMNEYLNKEGFYILDAFSNVSGAALSLKKANKWFISFNSDYYTHFDDYNNAMTVDEYFKFLIRSKGIKSLRSNQKNCDLIDSNLNTRPDEFTYYE